MKILIATEFRVGLYRGDYYLASQTFTIFKRYADAFGPVTILGRIEALNSIPVGCRKADFISSVIEVKSLASVLLGIDSAFTDERIGNIDLIIGRLPSLVAYRAYDYAKKRHIKFMAELMCDGWDSYWSHSIAGKLIAPYTDGKMRSVTAHSDYAIYVTKDYLQHKYPCNCPNINASNVVIHEPTDDVMKKRASKLSSFDKKHLALMTTADVDNKSKGHRYVIEAMELLLKDGIAVTYYLAGGGNQDYLRSIARKHNVADNVVFLGRLTIDDIFKKIDDVDIYIQPSLQEGLPRSVIEAMSRGCACIGARTAGMPELIDSDFVVRRKSATDIAHAIRQYTALSDDKRMEIALKNFNEAKLYTSEVLDKRRNEFFNQIRREMDTE